jgi:hypothetical protein
MALCTSFEESENTNRDGQIKGCKVEGMHLSKDGF